MTATEISISNYEAIFLSANNQIMFAWMLKKIYKIYMEKFSMAPDIKIRANVSLKKLNWKKNKKNEKLIAY